MTNQAKGTIIGFLIGASIELLFRGLFRLTWGFVSVVWRFWYIVLPISLLMHGYFEFRYWWNDFGTRDAIYASFDKTQVKFRNARLFEDGYKWVVEMDVVNDSPARVHNIRPQCFYKIGEEKSYIGADRPYLQDVPAGQTVRIKLPLSPDGGLMTAEPGTVQTVGCEASFNHIADDLFKGDMKKHSLDSQMEVTSEVRLVAMSQGRWALDFHGTVFNRSQVRIKAITFYCEVANWGNAIDGYGRTFDNLDLLPGKGRGLGGNVVVLNYKPESFVCHSNHALTYDQ